MASDSTRRVYLIDLVCCWSGMIIALLLFVRLFPSSLQAICGGLAPQVDAACLVAAAGMIAGGLAASRLNGSALRGERLLTLAFSLAAMLFIHASVRPETAFLSPSGAAVALVVAMSPSMIAGYAAAILVLLLISPICGDREGSSREESRK
jgi:hypothetical protein